MAITQIIPPFTTTPLRTNPSTFSEDTDTYHTELAGFISACENWRTQANTTQEEINAKDINTTNNANSAENNANSAENSANSAENSANSAENSKIIAEQKANEILGYVIPTEAVDSQAVRDEKDKNIIDSNLSFSGLGIRNVDEKLEISWSGLVGTIQNDISANVAGVLYPIKDANIDLTGFVPDVRVESTTTTSATVNKGNYVVYDKYVSNAVQLAETSNTILADNGAKFDNTTLVYVKPATDNAYIDTITNITTNTITFATSRTKTAENYEIVAVSNIFRATRDTADMKTYIADITSTFVIKEDETVFLVDNASFTNGTVGHYYLRINGDYTGQINYSEGFNNPVSWKDLGTASNMSIYNPYFQDRTAIGVTNQVLATLKVVGDTVETHTEVAFIDFIQGQTQKGFMLANGFAERAIGLYVKGIEEHICLGFWQTLNDGGYEPVLNPHGCSKYIDLGVAPYREWTHDFTGGTYNTVIDTTAKTLIRANGKNTDGVWTGEDGSLIYGQSGHPQNKYYDVVYEDQFIPLWNSAREFSNIEQLQNKIKKIANGSYKGFEGTVFTEQKKQTTTGTVATIEANSGLGNYYKKGRFINLYSATDGINGVYKIDSVSGDTITLTTTIAKTATDYIISGGAIPVYAYNNGLNTDVILNPANASAKMKDRLLQGLPLVGLYYNTANRNTNASQIPNGATDNFLASKAWLNAFNSIRSTDNGATWSSFTPAVDKPNNNYTLTNEANGNIILNQYEYKVEYFTSVDNLTNIAESDYIYASNINDIENDITVAVNNVTGKISIGTDATERLVIQKEANDIVSHFAETLTEDALLRIVLAEDADSQLYLGVHFATDGIIDMSDDNKLYTPINFRRSK